MDTFYRLLPIIVVLTFAFLVNAFQANAQTYSNPVPLQYEYQSGNVNDNFTTNQSSLSNNRGGFNINPFWGLIVLLIPTGYFLWNRHGEDFSTTSQPVGRGYSIAYQDIRRTKKKATKTIKNPKAM